MGGGGGSGGSWGEEKKSDQIFDNPTTNSYIYSCFIKGCHSQ